MTSKTELERMVMQFKVSDLQVLLGFAGQNRNGRKTELQKRAVHLIYHKMSVPLEMKIRNIYRVLLAENQKQINDMRYQPSTFGYSNYYTNDYSMSRMMSRSSSNYYLGPLNSASYYNSCQEKNNSYYAPPSNALSSQQPSQVPKFDYSSILEAGTKLPQKLDDFHFKELSFFNYKSDIIPLSTMIPQSKSEDSVDFLYSFSVSSQVHNLLGLSKRNDKAIRYQIQLRICLVDQETLNNCAEMVDSLPLQLSVKVNEKVCQLPPPIPSTNKQGMLLKRMNAPINLTPYCSRKNNVNKLTISWSTESKKPYGFTIHLVEKYTSDELINRLKRERQRNAEVTKTYICDKLNEDDDVAATAFKVSLICPLGKIVISLPVRATTCNHVQCFDGSLYIKMNEVKSVWHCPVCNQTCYYEDLFIDGFFVDILSSKTLSSNVTDVQINADGSWEPIFPKKRKNAESHNSSNKRIKLEAEIKKENELSVVRKLPDTTSKNNVSLNENSKISSTAPIQTENEDFVLPVSSHTSPKIYDNSEQTIVTIVTAGSSPLVTEDTMEIIQNNVVVVDLTSDCESDEDHQPLNLVKDMNHVTETYNPNNISNTSMRPPIYSIYDSDDDS